LLDNGPELIDLTQSKKPKHFPGEKTIGSDEFIGIRSTLYQVIEHDGLHLIFDKSKNKAAWISFYQKSFGEGGYLSGVFAEYAGKNPEKKFRFVLFKGIEVDAARYEENVALGVDPESMHPYCRRAYKLHAERKAAEDASKKASAAAKDKADKKRLGKERVEERLGLRAGGAVTPSPVAGTNPASLLGKQPSSGESSIA
jgi:hypothetical protein